MDDQHNVTVASVQIDVVNGDVLATRAKVMKWAEVYRTASNKRMKKLQGPNPEKRDVSLF